MQGQQNHKPPAEEEVCCGVISRNWDAVRAYLEQDADLASLLPAVCEQARNEFGPDAELALEVYRDPEVKDAYLTLYVRLKRYATDTMERLDRVGQRFTDKLEQVSGYLLLTTDFRGPGGTNGV
ncbi:MAG TPA: hypothetical protein VG013_26960 [Gemmataceae bacterium]|jgi:hypothetical protein|nr:hypothetical protein [Gemmataceae bacterium]